MGITKVAIDFSISSGPYRTICFAGGAGLHSLVYHLSALLQKSVKDKHTGWQCTAASIITVMTETLFGACTAWQPSVWLDTASEDPEEVKVVAPLLERLQEDLVCDELWGVPSHNTISDPANTALSPQVTHSLQKALPLDSSYYKQALTRMKALALLTKQALKLFLGKISLTHQETALNVPQPAQTENLVILQATQMV